MLFYATKLCFSVPKDTIEMNLKMTCRKPGKPNFLNKEAVVKNS
jgi:hypothetical protein